MSDYLTLKELRQRLPEYDSVSDHDLVNALYNKFVVGKATSPSTVMTKEDFDKALGYQPMGVVEDTIKSAGTGAMHGLADIAAAPGNLLGMTNDLGDWAYSKFTGNPAPQHHQLLPKTEDINNMMSGLTNISLHQPEGNVARYTYDAARGITGAAVPMGGARTAGQLASNAFRYGAVPAVAGEAAGDLAKKYIPDVEKIVRTAVPVIAGGTASVLEKAPKGKIPYENLDPLKKANYAASAAEGVVVKPQAVAGMAHDMINNAITKGWDQTIAGAQGWDRVTANIRFLHRLAVTGKAMTLEELDHLRQRINDSVNLSDPDAARVAMGMKNTLDKGVDSLNSAHVYGNTGVKSAVKYMKEGRKLASMKFKSDFIQKQINDAHMEAEAKGGLTGAQKLRDKFLRLAKDDEYMATLKPDEREAVYGVIRHSNGRDLARWVGSLAPTSALAATVKGGIGAMLGSGSVGNFSDWANTGVSGVKGLGIGLGMLGAGLAGRGADILMTKKRAGTAEAVTRGAKAHGDRSGLSTQQALQGYTEANETPDFGTSDVPTEMDSVNKWRTKMGLQPIAPNEKMKPAPPMTDKAPAAAFESGALGDTGGELPFSEFNRGYGK